ncbi:ExsB family protein [Blastomonas sp. AAP25]|uniref:7-cyano-7-deazaguanine synthase n=1 Tax=Blastomonas sp. AAP25 TaxID=1523416 RepID=UPI0006B8AB5D|nr:7-cyano-7-deazaguanine synthase [Blastomonas sp. AAP25]KPF73897.1 ExsB family protein [Blastomonas sp. AAP25]
MIALLLSGGVDSVALAFWKRPVVAITIDYGQRAAASEIAAARHVAELLTMSHEVVSVDCSSLGSGDMAGCAPLTEAPVSEWWPYRNQLLVTLGAMKAIGLGAGQLMIGSVATDAVHVDGTPEFYQAMDRLTAMQEGGLRVTAPAVSMTTAELVRSSGVTRDVIAWAHSCHTGPFACGDCRGCYKHQQVMEELYGDAY